MLELIVLGQIPGTGIIVTFQWVLAAATIFIGTTLLYISYKRRLSITELINNEVSA